MADALLITEDTEEAIGATLRDLAPDLVHVLIGPDGPHGPLDDVRIAFVTEGSLEVGRQFAKVLPECHGLRWLHSAGVGVDHPVFGTLFARGVRVTNATGANGALIGQTAILFVLAHSRGLSRWAEAQRAEVWAPHDVENLDGKVLGVVGLGPIGLTVARLGEALGMRVIGLRRSPRGDEPGEVWTLDRMDELVDIVDYLVLAIPSTPETNRILSRDRIARLKPSAYVVNVARGALMDEQALVDALAEGRIAGAALDAFDVEPLPADHPLWTLPNVTITPHSSGRNAIKGIRATELFVENLGHYVRGEPLVNEVTPS